MGKSWRKFAVLSAVLVAVNVAGWVWVHHELTNLPAEMVRVVSALPETDVDDTDRFTLVFDRPMVSETRVGEVEEAALFEVEPAWPGRWRWTGRERLEFQLEKPLPPGRIFTVSATDALEAHTGKVLDGASAFEFPTRALALTASEIKSYDRKNITVELRFNQPVDPGELLRHLVLYDGEGVPAEGDDGPTKLEKSAVLTKTPGETLVVRARRPLSDHLTLVLDGALTGHEAQRSLGEQVVRRHDISSRLTFVRTNVGTPGLGQTLWVRLRFSRRLKPGQKFPELTVTPSVEALRVRGAGRELVLTGHFTPGRQYKVGIPATLLAENGETLGKDASVTVKVPNRRPQLAIPHSRGVLSPRGRLMLDVNAVNVEGIHFTAWRVYENNLNHYLLRNWYVSDSGRRIVDRTIPLDLRHDTPQTVAVDLRKLLKRPRGLYWVHTSATNRRWVSDSSLINVTDLAVTAKRERNGAVVWVTSLVSGKPVADADVKAWTRKNQVLATGRTDAEGIARLRFPVDDADGGAWVVTAAKSGDLSYLKLGENQWVVDNVARSGRTYVSSYEIMLYTERGVYRPGNVIHLTGIIRDGAGGVPPAFPLVVKVSRPDGRRVAELPVKADDNRQGVFHIDFPTREDGQTGPYTFKVTLPGAKEVLGSKVAMVEAFMPVRMAVSAEPSAEWFGPKDTPKLKLSGRYLWDEPASGLAVAVEGTLRAVPFRSKMHPDFRFSTTGAQDVTLPTTTGALDEEGKATLDITMPTFPAGAGVYRMRLAATVTEPGGRSVSANASAVLDRCDRHVGMHLAGGQVTRVGLPVPIDWVCVTGEDKPAEPAAMTMTFYRVEWDSVVKKVNRRWVWQSVERTEKVDTQQIAAVPESRGTFRITCPDAGSYRVVLSDTKTGRDWRLGFYAYDASAGRQSVPMNRPERLEIVLDREKYVAGDTAKVLVRSPIPGMLWLTLETDRVVTSRVAEIAQNTAEIELTLPEGLRGGAFVTASVVRAVDPDAKSWLPHRAMGMTRLEIDHASQRVRAVITAPKQALPGETVEVIVDAGSAGDPARPPMVHLWAVDEGILLTTAYRTPDPTSFFLKPRLPGVATADIFFQLLPDYARPEGMTRIGADGDPLADFHLSRLYRSPVPSRRREPAVLWRKTVPVDDDGRVRVAMTMPDMIGAMRLMAVVVDGDRYGSARHDVTLSSPLMVETTWPRFAAPGDAFDVPVKLFNTTDRELKVRVKTTVKGPVAVKPEGGFADLIVSPGRPVTQFLKVKATGMGPVEVRVDAEEVGAEGKALTAKSEARFPVRPASPLHSEVALMSIEAGKRAEITVSDAFVAKSTRMTVEVSAGANVQLAPALERLLGYPHGCVEQTTSKLYSLVYAADVLGSDRMDAVGAMVQAGVTRLWSMQTQSGGLSYWPGGAHPCLWGTAYAAGCLLEADAAGHKIDRRFLKELVKYLESELRTTGDDAPDDNTKALICRVMSVFGTPPSGWMSRLAEKADELDLAGRCHLAAAFHAAGRKDRALALLPASAPKLIPTTTSERRLTSRTRQEAVWLLVLLDVDPQNAAVVPLAAKLERARKQRGYWGSTLNNAAAIAALSKYQALHRQEAPDFTGEVRAKGAEPVTFDHTKPVRFRAERAAGPVVITSKGAGTLYVAVTTEGLAKPGVVKPYNRDLTVTRRWFGRDRKPVDLMKLHVGDLVRVEVTMVSPRDDVHNVAIVDALPGGVEVENPRLAISAKTNSPGGDMPDHVEFLDDRVVLFATAGKRKRTYKYSLRVTTIGAFTLPPIQASCMYDASVASLGEAASVKVEK